MKIKAEDVWRKIRHWFGHEWVNITPIYQDWSMTTDVQEQVCAYPGCKARSLWSTRVKIRYGRWEGE